MFTINRKLVNDTAAELASAFPANARKSAKEMYALFFDTYEKQYPKDLAGGLAVLMFGGYEAFHNRVLPEDHFHAIYKQWQQLLAKGEAAHCGAPKADQEQTYVRAVMQGMQLTVATQKNLRMADDSADVARMKVAGKQALQELMKVEASRIELTDQGFSIK